MKSKNEIAQALSVIGYVVIGIGLIASIIAGVDTESFIIFLGSFFGVLLFAVLYIALSEILHLLQLQYDEISQLKGLLNTTAANTDSIKSTPKGSSLSQNSFVPANAETHKPAKSLSAVIEEEYVKKNTSAVVCLSHSENVSYVEDCSIVIAKSGLYRSEEYDVVFCGFTFFNASDKVVKGLKISLSAYDAFGETLDGYDGYQYIDLKAEKGQSFGNDKIILLPDKFTRSIKITKITVLYDDGSLEQYGIDKIVTDPKLKKLADCFDFDTIRQYKLDLEQAAVYVPIDFGRIWFCSCGRINIGDMCDECRCIKKFVFSTFDKYSKKITDNAESDDSDKQSSIDSGNQTSAELDEYDDVGLKMKLAALDEDSEEDSLVTDENVPIE